MTNFDVKMAKYEILQTKVENLKNNQFSGFNDKN